MLLKKWKSSDNYMGWDISDWYVVYSKTRDCGLLNQSNFDCIWDDLQELRDNDPGYIDEKCLDAVTIDIHHFNHWACGWIDVIMIQESNQEALDYAEDIAAQLDQYPVFNDEDFYQKESDYAQKDVAKSAGRDDQH